MDLQITFERNLYRAVINFKKEHQKELDERTRQRKERERRKESEG